MLSYMRKVVEAAIARRITSAVKIEARQYGVQRGLSPTTTLIDVNSLVRKWLKNISSLDLTKAYDKVNRTTLWKDCKKRLNLNLCMMILARFQKLSLSTKGDVTGTTTFQRLGLTQFAPLSPVLFLKYIDDLA